MHCHSATYILESMNIHSANFLLYPGDVTLFNWISVVLLYLATRIHVTISMNTCSGSGYRVTKLKRRNITGSAFYDHPGFMEFITVPAILVKVLYVLFCGLNNVS
jgi:hypothetical protein